MTQRQERVLAIAAHLSATGLGIRLNQGDHACELTATRHVWGLQDIEITLDQDGYCELRCWTSPKATPEQVAAALTQGVAAVSSVCAPALHPSQDRIEPPSGPVAGYDGAVTDGTGDGGMPGPQDQVVKPMPAPDHVPPGPPDAPREGKRPAESALQERLKQLRPNHPSSLLHDHAPRNASSDYIVDETPLQVEDDSVQDKTPAQQDRRGETLGHGDDPTIGLDGSWEWKGYRLTSDQSQAGDGAVEKCRAAERSLTPAVRGVEGELTFGRLVHETEKYAVKSIDRFKEKLAKLIERHPSEDPDQLAASIHDGVRYTFLFDTDRYVEGTDEATHMLENRGFELRVRKNTWGENEYKGVNTRWFDSENDLLFEVQFHTEESWITKQRTHDAYAKINDPRTPPFDVESLRTEQSKISEKVSMPPRWYEIPDYRKEP